MGFAGSVGDTATTTLTTVRLCSGRKYDGRSTIPTPRRRDAESERFVYVLCNLTPPVSHISFHPHIERERERQTCETGRSSPIHRPSPMESEKGDRHRADHSETKSPSPTSPKEEERSREEAGGRICRSRSWETQMALPASGIPPHFPPERSPSALLPAYSCPSSIQRNLQSSEQ